MIGEVYEIQKDLKEKLEEVLMKEYIHQRQRSRELWLKKGDRNTKSFHTSIKVRRYMNIIFQIKCSSSRVLKDEKDIQKEVV